LSEFGFELMPLENKILVPQVSFKNEKTII